MDDIQEVNGSEFKDHTGEIEDDEDGDAGRQWSKDRE